MRLTVFGATGGTGTEVVRQALTAGRQVTAVVRDPARPAVPPEERLSVVAAGVTEPEAIAGVLEDADIAVSALGHRRGDSVTICAEGIRSILAAMDKARVRRLVADAILKTVSDPAAIGHRVNVGY